MKDWGSSQEISLLAGKGVNQQCETDCHGVCRLRLCVKSSR